MTLPIQGLRHADLEIANAFSLSLCVLRSIRDAKLGTWFGWMANVIARFIQLLCVAFAERFGREVVYVFPPRAVIQWQILDLHVGLNLIKTLFVLFSCEHGWWKSVAGCFLLIVLGLEQC